jgi:hypothetical protein
MGIVHLVTITLTLQLQVLLQPIGKLRREADLHGTTVRPLTV